MDSAPYTRNDTPFAASEAHRVEGGSRTRGAGTAPGRLRPINDDPSVSLHPPPEQPGSAGIFLLFPRITVNRLTLATLVAVYVFLVSLHDERRLRATYGEPFERYRQEVPFLIPRLRG
jgi:hypothetical protein